MKLPHKGTSHNLGNMADISNHHIQTPTYYSQSCLKTNIGKQDKKASNKEKSKNCILNHGVSSKGWLNIFVKLVRGENDSFPHPLKLKKPQQSGAFFSQVIPNRIYLYYFKVLNKVFDILQRYIFLRTI